MKILVLDDETIILKGHAEMLTKLYPDSEVYMFIDPADALNDIKEKFIRPDIALLDIEMPGMNGLELAKALKDVLPQTKIIFVTGHSKYAVNAFKVRASGYLLKPIKEDEMKEEIDNALSALLRTPKSKVQVQTFGNFDVFADGKPVVFGRAKAKETFAYLVDRKGASVKAAEIAAVLWEDKPYDRSMQKQVQSIIWHMMKSLKAVGIDHIVKKQWNSISLNVNEIECDYYELLKMDVEALNRYMGEYMCQYSWAEMTVATLWHKLFK